MKTSAKGIALIKRFEGCRLKAYRDAVGVWTIGYGHTAMAGGLVPKEGIVITQAQADDMFPDDLVKYETAVTKVLRRDPTQSQFDAMVSLCYNIGAGGFANSSVARKFNDGDMTGAGNSFLMWNKAGGKVLAGLVNRRKAEKALFMSSSKAVAIPSPIPVPDLPDDIPAHPEASVKAEKPSLQKVMVWLVGAIVAAIAAYFGFGG